jgi:hypothetical protein
VGIIRCWRHWHCPPLELSVTFAVSLLAPAIPPYEQSLAVVGAGADLLLLLLFGKVSCCGWVYGVLGAYLAWGGGVVGTY